MFQDAIGRLHSPIRALDRSLSLTAFVDSGGWATENRVWAGVSAIGEADVQWLDSVMADLAAAHPAAVNERGELKGKDLPTADAKEAARRIRSEDRRVLAWFNWYPKAAQPRVAALRDHFLAALGERRAAPYRLDATRVEGWFRDMEAVFAELGEINQHKLISILAHMHWLVTHLAHIELAPQLARVRLVVDEENFPDPDRCATLVKAYLAASLQAAGMSQRLTGAAFREDSGSGAVVVNLEGKSVRSSGLQYTDVLLQVVQRQLPGFGARNAGTA